MMHYRRLYTKGATYFFTLITYSRQKILANSNNIQLLKKSITTARKKYPFVINALVILPDHLHCIITLPETDDDFSLRVRLIKTEFSRKCAINNLGENLPNSSRILKKEKCVWQRRFWEHQIRNAEDFSMHMDYVHYNPVKHGLAISPKDWQFSTFQHCVAKGYYNVLWGSEITEKHFNAIVNAE